MDRKTVKYSAGCAVVIFAFLHGIVAQGGNDSQSGRGRSDTALLTASAGQNISAPVKPDKDAEVNILNRSAEISDADFSAFDPAGTEIARETIEVNPGTTSNVFVRDVFPFLNMNDVGSIMVHVTVRAPQDLPDSVQLAVAFFSQRDSRWRYNQLGTCTGYTIGTAGCAISSIAMAAARSVNNMNPASLNTYLTGHGGFSGGCNVIWANAANVDGPYGFTYIESSSVSSAAHLKTYIDSSKFAVVRSARFSSHYGIIVGYRNQGASLSDFYYLDPWDLSATFRYVGDGWVSSASTVKVYR
jgi:hypothetical protein